MASLALMGATIVQSKHLEGWNDVQLGCVPVAMTLPYRDDLGAACARIEVLERATRQNLCERCASEAAARRRRPLLRALLGVGLALFAVVVAIPTVTAIVAEMRPYHGSVFHRAVSDV